MLRMRRLGLLLGLSLACGAAVAQPWRDGDRTDRPGMRDGPPHRLFISPFGEPFRQGDGSAAWFAQADTDHDGALTQAELRADALRFFKILDQNSDGAIDGFETARYENELAPEINRTFADPDHRPPGAEGDERGPGGPPPGGERRGRRGDRDGEGREGQGRGGHRGATTSREGAARFSYLDIPEPIRAADLNLDWRVSQAEWLKAADKRFGLLDPKGTGRLTLETLPPLPGMPQGRPPGGGPNRPPR